MAKKLVFDKLLFTTIVLLLVTGLAMVYSAGSAVARDMGIGPNGFLIKQGLAATLGIVAMLILMHLDYRQLHSAVVVYALVCGSLLLLVAVLFSPELNSTHRWFFVSGLSVQPSEFAKLALVPFIAFQIDRKQGLEHQRYFVVPTMTVTAAMAILIVLEPDMGNAVLVTVTALLMLFLAGLRWRHVLGAILVVLPLLWFLIVSVPYRRTRWLAFLDPEKDPLGSGFQALQSLIAVGSGGIFGLGPGNSLQKLYFLPYPHSDFIFSIVAEELGMIGAAALVSLFCVLLWRGVVAGWRAPDLFGRYLAWGLTGLLVLQALIHVSVGLALLPAKGIPLPLVSYGGSSLLASLMACGLLLNISQHG